MVLCICGFVQISIQYM